MKPNPAQRCIPTGCAVARLLQLHSRDIWEGPGLSILPQRALGASVARLTRNKGGWKFPATPGYCGNLRKTTITHAGRAERPTLRATPLRYRVGGRRVVRHLQQQVQCAGGAVIMLHPTQFGLILASWLLNAVAVTPFLVGYHTCFSEHLSKPSPTHLCPTVPVSSSAHSTQAASSSATGLGWLVVIWSNALLSTPLTNEKHQLPRYSQGYPHNDYKTEPKSEHGYERGG